MACRYYFRFLVKNFKNYFHMLVILQAIGLSCPQCSQTIVFIHLTTLNINISNKSVMGDHNDAHR